MKVRMNAFDMVNMSSNWIYNQMKKCADEGEYKCIFPRDKISDEIIIKLREQGYMCKKYDSKLGERVKVSWEHLIEKRKDLFKFKNG